MPPATSPTRSATPASGSGWALPWCGISARPGKLGSPGMLSWGGILGTSFWIDPKERLVGVMMTQQFPNADGLGDTFQTLVYQAVTR